MQCRTGERPTHSGKTRLSEERDWRRLGLWLSWQGACGARTKPWVHPQRVQKTTKSRTVVGQTTWLFPRLGVVEGHKVTS